MNIWVKRSVRLARSRGYLDRLQAVYPPEPGDPHIIGNEKEREVIAAFRSRNARRIIEVLLPLKRFPIKHPYVAFLKQDPDAIRRNPRTVNNLAKQLVALGPRRVLLGAKAPKEANTRFGQSFKNWIQKLGITFLKENAFEAERRRLVLLEGSDIALRRYANEFLDMGLPKNPDFLARRGNRFVVGEAKFISAGGGHQDRAFEDALKLLEGHHGNAQRVALLDGVVWLENRGKMFRAVQNFGGPLLSALLLKDFLRSL